MEVLGEVLHFSKSGRIIAKIENYNLKIRSGLIVIDEKNKKIGKISELIGPVISPYASIIPFNEKTNKIKGIKVFVDNPNKILKRRNTKGFIKKNKK